MCAECGAESVQKWSRVPKYCSNACRLVALNRDQERVPRMQGFFSASITPKGYVRGMTWDGDTRRSVMQHVFVMEQHLGRRLTKSERVHHINHDRADNRIENLKLYASQAEHMRHEHGH